MRGSSEKRPLRILVFGASGYIGSHAVHRLVLDGHEVTGVVRSERSAEAAAWTGASLHRAAIDTTDEMARLLLDHEAVVWAAQVMLEDELTFARFALETLRGTGKAFVFTSGTSLLSERTDGEWIDASYSEYDSFIPRRHIAPRLAIENTVREYGSRGVRALCVRPPLVWGHGGSQVIKDLYYSAVVTGSVCFVGRGLNAYSNVHVEDLAGLFSLAVDRGVPGALYHGVSGEQDYRSMAETVAGALGVPTRSVDVAQSIEIWDRFTGPIVFSSCSRTRAPRARAELGWEPTPALSDILQECASPEYRTIRDRPVPAHLRPSPS